MHPNQIVIHLSIELPETPAVVTALTTALRGLVELPGITVRAGDETPALQPAIPHPRRPVEDAANLISIAPHSRTVIHRGALIPLTRLEFDLLLYLVRRPNRVHGRRTLLTEVWGSHFVSSRTVDVHVRRLRTKLGDARQLITTVRGVGYRFDGTDHVDVVTPGPFGLSAS